MKIHITLADLSFLGPVLIVQNDKGVNCELEMECLQREGFKELTGVSGSRVSPNLVERSSTRSLCSNTTPGTVSPEKASGDAPGLFRICPPLTQAVTRNSRLSGGAE